jgi:putative spermidine/putrescine transport system permease protein
MRSHEFDRRLLALWTVLVGLFVMLPLVFVLAVSLTPRAYISLPTEGISLRWYARLLSHPSFLESGLNSLLLAAVSAAAALMLGVLAALATVRWRFALRETVRIAVTAPLFVPMVMTGLAILMRASAAGWTDPPTRLFVGHVVLTLPYVVRTVSASLAGFDPNQELAAQNLGASPIKAFWLVTLPQLGPGVLAGGVFAFIVSFDNVGLSIFLTGATWRTLPVELFAYATTENDPMSAAVSVVMIVLSLAAVALLERLFGLQRLMGGQAGAA